MPSHQTKRLRSRDVRARYNDISERTLSRWERDPVLGFPQPMVINRRKFWNENELDAFDAARVTG
jgi:hypothetical protein